jgi:hypothetical protein
MSAAKSVLHMRLERGRSHFGSIFQIVYRTRRARMIWRAAACGMAGHDVETFGRLPKGGRGVCEVLVERIKAV